MKGTSAVNRGITHSYREKSREPGKNLLGSGAMKEGKLQCHEPMRVIFFIADQGWLGSIRLLGLNSNKARGACFSLLLKELFLRKASLSGIPLREIHEIYVC